MCNSKREAGTILEEKLVSNYDTERVNLTTQQASAIYHLANKKWFILTLYLGLSLYGKAHPHFRSMEIELESRVF